MVYIGIRRVLLAGISLWFPAGAWPFVVFEFLWVMVAGWRWIRRFDPSK